MTTDQVVWSIILSVCWVVVSFGQYNQGKKIKTKETTKNVSVILPLAVIFAQVILFIKGVYYSDWSLIAGAIAVNIGALYNLFYLIKYRNR